MAHPVVSAGIAVQDRVDDARLLWAEGRREGAFLLALIAVVVRARQNFPPPVSEGEAFRCFIESRLNVRLSVEYRSSQWPIERVLYKWLRCELVHQGGIPVDIRFKNDAAPGELSVRAGGSPHYVLLVSPGWFDHLLEWALS